MRRLKIILTLGTAMPALMAAGVAAPAQAQDARPLVLAQAQPPEEEQQPAQAPAEQQPDPAAEAAAAEAAAQQQAAEEAAAQQQAAEEAAAAEAAAAEQRAAEEAAAAEAAAAEQQRAAEEAAAAEAAAAEQRAADEAAAAEQRAAEEAAAAEQQRQAEEAAAAEQQRQAEEAAAAEAQRTQEQQEVQEQQEAQEQQETQEAEPAQEAEQQPAAEQPVQEQAEQPAAEPEAETQAQEQQPAEQPASAAQQQEAEDDQRRRQRLEMQRRIEQQQGQQAQPEQQEAAPAQQETSPQPQGEDDRQQADRERDGERRGDGDRDRDRADRDRDGDRRDRGDRNWDRDRDGRDRDGRREARGDRPDWSRERGERLDRQPRFDAPRDAQRVEGGDNRVIFDLGSGEIVIRHDETRRLRHRAEDVYYDRLDNGLVRTTIERPDGVRIVTIEDEYGNVLERTRILPGGREIVLVAPPRDYDYRRGPNRRWRDPALDLPPITVTMPRDQYILEAERADRQAYVRTLQAPPVQELEQTYSLEDVRYSERVRDLMPRVDLDSINFDTGSAQVTQSEIDKLSDLAYAMQDMLDEDPAETFLIEGHTDAVGSDTSNLALSDRRAESVASALTEVYNIPPENLVTQGYGEEYLKVATQGAERENRRVTVRRITPLVNPVAQAQ